MPCRKYYAFGGDIQARYLIHKKVLSYYIFIHNEGRLKRCCPENILHQLLIINSVKVSVIRLFGGGFTGIW